MLEEVTRVDRVEVLHPSQVIQVRLANEILKNGEVIAASFSRYILEPTSDLSGQPEEVVRICEAVWA
jgi:hypothetical protein